MKQQCTSTQMISSPVIAGSALYLIFDQVRTGTPEHGGILSGWQWETLRGKLLKAGFSPNSISLHLLSPSVLDSIPRTGTIVGFGEATLRQLTGKRGVDKWVISPLKTNLGHNFVATYDFSRMSKQYELNLYLDFVLRRAFALTSTSSPWPTTTENFLLNPGLEETLDVLNKLKEAETLAVDVETGYGQINTVGFAWSPSDAIAINVLPDRLGDYSYYELWTAIRAVLEAPSRKIFQNFIYDVSYFSAYGIRTANIHHDTMWAMKVLWPELKSNLGNVGRIYTNRPYWKDDGKVTDEEGAKKSWGNIRDWDRHYRYNCLSKDMKVLTNEGWVKIASIVQAKKTFKVYSWNEACRRFEWRRITNWIRNRERKNILWTVIKTEGMAGKRGLHVTPDHKILTQRGWIRADEVKPYDYMLKEGLRHDAGTIWGTILGDSSLEETSDKSVAYMSCTQRNAELINLKQELFGGTVTQSYLKTGYGEGDFYNLYVSPCAQLARINRFNDIPTILNNLTSMGIALWFMDDGCQQKQKYSPYMCLALQSYTKEAQIEILKFFRQRYGLNNGCIDKAGNLRLSTKMSARLCAEIGSYIVPTMRYKMSHSGPDYSFDECMKFKSKVEPINVQVIEVTTALKNKRGYSTSYCISVDETANFMTEYGIVSNCSDTTGTFEASENQRRDLKDRGLLGFFDDYVMRLASPIQEMCANGIPLCAETKARLAQETEEQVKALTLEFQTKIGSPVNPNSSRQLLTYLKTQGVKLPKKMDKETGLMKESADAASIKKIRLKSDCPGLAEVQEIKTLSKALSSYLRFDVRSDGRLSYSLNGCGTETLRFSSTSDPWGRGFGPLTIPREGGAVSVKSMFVAPEGWTFIEADLKAAETYYVAYASVCKKLIEMLRDGEDVHKHVAHAILKALGQPASAYEKKWRDLGKKTGHGANYLMKEGTFVENVFKDMDMILKKTEGKAMLESYFAEFPEIRAWHGDIKRELYLKRKLTAPTGWERYFYGRPGDEMLREAVPWGPQHTVPWIINHMMFYLRSERERGNLKFQLLTQVHDALYLLVPDEWVERVGLACLATEKWHPRVSLPGGELMIPVEVELAKCLAHKSKFTA